MVVILIGCANANNWAFNKCFEFAFLNFILLCFWSFPKKVEIFFFCLQIIKNHEHLTKPVPF